MSTFESFDKLDVVEQRFLQETHRRLHARDPWTRGLYAEALVAYLLPGAQLAAHSASPHDVEWTVDGRTITIAVRATGSYSMDHRFDDVYVKPFPGSWKFGPPKRAWDPTTQDFVRDHKGEVLRRCWADVAVLCHHTDFNIESGWNFFALPRSVIETWPSSTLTPKSLMKAGHTAPFLEQIEQAVRMAAGHWPPSHA